GAGGAAGGALEHVGDALHLEPPARLALARLGARAEHGALGIVGAAGLLEGAVHVPGVGQDAGLARRRAGGDGGVADRGEGVAVGDLRLRVEDPLAHQAAEAAGQVRGGAAERPARKLIDHHQDDQARPIRRGVLAGRGRRLRRLPRRRRALLVAAAGGQRREGAEQDEKAARHAGLSVADRPRRGPPARAPKRGARRRRAATARGRQRRDPRQSCPARTRDRRSIDGDGTVARDRGRRGAGAGGRSGPEEGRALSASAALGAGMFGAQPSQSLELGVDLSGPGYALGIGGRARWLAGEGFRAAEWDEASEIAAGVVRYGLVAWEADDGSAAVSAAVGELGGVTLGHGSIVDGYASGLDVDHGHLGAQVRAARGALAFEALVDDVIAPRIGGARMSWRAAERVELGAQLAGDRAAPEMAMDGAPGSAMVAAAALDAALLAGGEEDR